MKMGMRLASKRRGEGAGREEDVLVLLVFPVCEVSNGRLLLIVVASSRRLAEASNMPFELQ